MFYVLGFRPEHQELGGFHVTTDSARALRLRFDWERDATGDDEVVVISAPDLHELTQAHSRYFTRYACVHRIDDCYFCRAYLAHKENPINMDRVEILSQAARMNGHCLLCHDPYPVWCQGGHYHLDEGFQEHLRGDCAVTCELEWE